MWKAFLDTLPRGYTVSEEDWQRRHRILLWLLAAHVPALVCFGLVLGRDGGAILGAVSLPVVCAVLGYLLSRHRRWAAVIVTLGFVYSSAALVGLTGGAIEAHFHFFIIIGFVALYQDWAPFLFMILFTTVSHGIGSVWQQSLIFNHTAGQTSPWLWSLIHGVAVLLACVGTVLFWRIMEESQEEKEALTRQLAAADADANRRRFTSDLLVNLARRNQSMLYRQLDIINQLEESERDPDTLAELFTLDHLATRVRRNAESLLVLSGEQPPRTWSKPVALRDVLRAAIAETEDLERVVFVVDEELAVSGHTVTDLTHLIAELTENAVRFSPPDSAVTIRARPDRRDPGGQVLTIEDWGVGMPPADMAAANATLAEAHDVDLSVSQRLGFHVVARLGARHGISVSLSATPGSGITAVAVLPAALFTTRDALADPGPARTTMPATTGTAAAPPPSRADSAQPPAIDRTQPLDVVRHKPAESPAAPLPAPSRPATAAPAKVTAPAATASGTPTYSPFGSDQGWLGWWEPEAQPEQGAMSFALPSPRPRMTPPAPSAPAQTESTPSAPAQTSPAHAAPTRAPARSAPAQATSGQAAPVRMPEAPAQRTMTTGPAAAAESAPVDPALGLRRRVPQAHLAPELREPLAGPASVGPAVPGQVSEAASALSRYQASRQAAQTTVDGDGSGWRS